MIPYYQILQFSFVPISIQSWGTMVALGFLTAILLSRWFLKKKGLNHEVVWDFGLAGIIGAILFARIFHVIFYRPGRIVFSFQESPVIQDRICNIHQSPPFQFFPLL